MWIENIKQFFRPKFEIYTDGARKKNLGSWAFVGLRNSQILVERTGLEKNAGSNRMEFQAALEALTWLPPRAKAVLYTDSRILVEAMLRHRPKWKQHGWVDPGGRAIPHLDLVQRLDGLLQSRTIRWQWVRAHAGNAMNERCDQLCIRAREPHNFQVEPNLRLE